MKKQDSQIKSRERVSSFGEVYTSEKEVKAMLDLVKNQTYTLDSRFLEPACGNGNFLAEVLERKLELLNNLHKKNQHSFHKFSMVLIGSLYGIDIILDNVLSARDRLFEIFKKNYLKIYKEENDILLKNVIYILKKNIVNADALTFLTADKKPLILSEWSLVDDKIKRRDFEYKNLIGYSPFEEGTLFSDLGEEVILPSPIKEYPLNNFYKIYETSKDT